MSFDETPFDQLKTEDAITLIIERIKILNKKVHSKENDKAITKLEESRMWLRKRTEDREKRGVEGKNIP